jgi:hypothetical protein
MNAQFAADSMAESLRGVAECRGNVIVATDDNGRSAESTI